MEFQYIYLIQLLHLTIILFYSILGDYKDNFLKAVGWDQQRNPENLPAGLVPGSDNEDDEDDNIEDYFTRLSLNSGTEEIEESDPQD